MVSRTRVYVSTTSGRTVKLELGLRTTVVDLKEELHLVWHVPVLCQQILKHTKLLEDSTALASHIDREGVLSVSLIVCSNDACARINGAKQDEILEAFITWATWDYDRANIMLQACSHKYLVPYTIRSGFIPKGGDVLVQTMTVEEAMKKCASIPNCLGFTFQGIPNEGPVKIYFKRKDNIKGSGWTTYLAPKKGGIELRRCHFKIIESAMRILSNAAITKRVNTDVTKEFEDLKPDVLLELVPMMMKIWPPCLEDVVAGLGTRFHTREPSLLSRSDTEIIKLLGRLAPQGDPGSVAAFCACLEMLREDVEFNMAATKALQQHAPNCHEGVIAALCGCIANDLGRSNTIKTLMKLTPRGHENVIATLRTALLCNPKRPSTVSKRQIEAALQMLTIPAIDIQPSQTRKGKKEADNKCQGLAPKDPVAWANHHGVLRSYQAAYGWTNVMGQPSQESGFMVYMVPITYPLNLPAYF